MENKAEEVNKLLDRFKAVMRRSLEKGNIEKAMAAVSAACEMLYYYNQVYIDDDLEAGVYETGRKLKAMFGKELESYHADDKTVMFYDGFGMDTRGVAKMYLNALKKNGYKIIYVTNVWSKGQMPDTDELLSNADHETVYIDYYRNYTGWATDLMRTIIRTRPKAMFYYTLPFDAAGAAAFAAMEGKASRFLIDLTDHAFWLGKVSNDFFCGSREMSASNQVYERGIDPSKLIKLGVNLIIDDGGTDHSGLPFDVENTRYIFSGGSLYKTLGDENNYFYRIADHILASHPDIRFLYAGEGDRTEMDKILEKYPGRAFLIAERKDFYYLIRNCTLYLNTYPMFGGMMMKYSANAGRLPITLRHENDSDGLLIDQPSRKIEYDSFEELIADVDRLLSDDKYLKEREALLEGSVISEARFVNNVRTTIEEHHTDYCHSGERIDTSRFKEEFYTRFSIRQAKENISRMTNRSIFVDFPWMPCIKIKNRLFGRFHK